MEIRNKTRKCCYPDCPKPVPETEILCPKHKAASEAAAELLSEEERAQGWPPTQFEEGDA